MKPFRDPNRKTRPTLTSVSPDVGHSLLPTFRSALGRLHSNLILVCAAAMALSVMQAAGQEPILPNGASSLQETYQDWQLSCTVRGNSRSCVLLQDQSLQNGQRQLAVEIGMRDDGAVATMLLPFGILFDNGVTPQIDDQAPLQPLRFRTCLPTGCIVIFPIDSAMFEKLRAGTSLKLAVMTASQTPMTFSVSLKGLTAAFDRLQAITGS